ncbi:hypothetical protein [Streptomyces sp. UH6]|uniref:hypothetical protein n=1 Tax=Streptomyces sp. UH6 TaxID=2748379 RepID=UPI0015D4CF9B|nr:hypothetical protein [Streptomyces sp. UH6]NYV74334.1 hypothetical protein [Streptomyces sp. UH6]
MSEWRQVDLSRWEQAHGERGPVALFSLTVHEPPFSELTFEYPADEDGLGFAAIELMPHLVVAVIDDPNNPFRGTHVWKVGEVEPEAVLRAFMNAFGLQPFAVLWQAGQKMIRP